MPQIGCNLPRRANGLDLQAFDLLWSLQERLLHADQNLLAGMVSAQACNAAGSAEIQLAKDCQADAWIQLGWGQMSVLAAQLLVDGCWPGTSRLEGFPLEQSCSWRILDHVLGLALR